MKSRFIFPFLAVFWSAMAFGSNEKLFSAPSIWLVSMEGHYLTWILRIAQVDPSGQLIGATYSNTLNDAERRPINGSVSTAEEKVVLTYVTPSGTPITFTRQPDGSFVGSFTNKKGLQKTAGMKPVSETDIPGIAAAERQSQTQEAIVQPGADVPLACAFFSGEWQGTWSVSGYGQLFLWVEAIDKNCNAKIRYSDKPIRGKSSLNVEMQKDNGSFSFVCNQSTGGTCVITRKGEGAYVNYSNPQGGRNGAYLEKKR